MLVKRRFYPALLLLGLVLLAAFLALKPRGDAVVYEGKSIRAWALAAASGDAAAKVALGKMGTNAVPGLVDLLNRRESFVQRQASALSMKLPRRIARVLFGWTARRDAVACRCAAARALGLLGPEAESAIPALVGALRDGETQVGNDAAAALGRIGKAAVPELMRTLAGPDAFARNLAAYALGQIGPAAESALPALIGTFADTNRFARDAAIYSAMLIATPSMVAISNLLDHGDPNAREAAVNELVLFRRSLQIPIPALAKMAQAPESSSRRLAIAGLVALRLGDHTTMHTITNALADPAVEVRVTAVKGLKVMIWRAHEALPLLMQKLRDESPEVRQWTVSTLGDIGPRAAPAIPDLRRLAETDPALRALSTQAIGQIELSLPVSPR